MNGGRTVTKELRDWGFVGEIDPTIRVSRRHLARLADKRVYVTDYSPDRLFRNMAAGRISVFRGYPALTRPQFDRLGFTKSLVRIDPREKTNVSVVYKGQRERMKVGRVVKLWDDGGDRLGITDLHFRETPLEPLLHIDRISHFNIFCDSSEDVQLQEMMTVVLSTKGQYTDSHSDDPDGSNHCIAGKKLWLAWDTFEGMAHGLQDVERLDYDVEQAAFDIDAFLRLKSARWFTVKSGETLFLPGHLTHKVITLEKYVGFGSFYVALPNYLRTISRWIIHRPLWSLHARSNDRLIPQLAKTAVAKLKKIRKAPPQARRQSGYDYLALAERHWKKEYDPETRDELLQKRVIGGFYEEAHLH